MTRAFSLLSSPNEEHAVILHFLPPTPQGGLKYMQKTNIRDGKIKPIPRECVEGFFGVKLPSRGSCDPPAGGERNPPDIHVLTPGLSVIFQNNGSII